MNRQSIVVPEGLPFIVALLIITLILASVGFICFAAFFLSAAIFVTWFFRNPERKIPPQIEALTSPADGRIIKVDRVNLVELLKGQYVKISIFMNVFNVHVNRIPYSGKVKLIRYNKGKFISANLDKASELNENNAIVIVTDQGREYLTVQIAGLIARRIVCWIKEGMHVEKGERFGLIRFGSRLDVYVPAEL
ncbi:MAG: phosphatidylserine decarboxylase family protein, partial [Syntrophales bacterium LBB04]|nr:phosphatidylserine decarboxylase family protein [Syntrophales bacterium LBB04]